MKVIWLLLFVTVFAVAKANATEITDQYEGFEVYLKNQIKKEDQDLPFVENCGINIVLSEKFFNTFIKTLFPAILDIIDKNLIITEQTITINVKNLFTIHFNIIDLGLFASYDNNKTYVNLIDETNTISMHISNSSINVNLTYKNDFDPNIISDEGNLQLNISGLSLDLVFNIIPNPIDKKRFLIKVLESNFDLNPSGFSLDVVNQNQLGYVILQFIQVLRTPIIQTITTVISQYFGVAANEIISFLPIPLILGDVALDSSILKLPNITDGFLPIMLVGRFFPVNKDLPFNNTAKVPIYDEEGESLQVYISDFTLRSFTYTMNELGYLNVTVDTSPVPELVQFDVKSFGYFIPALKDRKL